MSPQRSSLHRMVMLGLAAFGIAVAVFATLADALAGRPFDPTRVSGWRVPRPDLHAVAARGANVWAVGYWGTVLVSSDGGEFFRYAETPGDETLFDVAFADDAHGWAVGERGTLLVTRDGGNTWRRQSVEIEDELGDRIPLETALLGVAVASKTEAWAVGDLGMVLRCRDGERWERVVIPESVLTDGNVAERIFNAVHFADTRHGVIVGEFGTVLRTGDGGATWTAERALEQAPEEPYLFDLGLSAAGPADGPQASVSPLAAAVTLAGTVLVSRDGGASWLAHEVPDDVALYAAAARDVSAVVAGNRGAIYWTSDGGGTWTASKRPRLYGWLGGATYANDDRVFVVGAQGALLRSDDGGRHFVSARGEHQATARSEAAAEDAPARVSRVVLQPTGEPTR